MSAKNIRRGAILAMAIICISSLIFLHASTQAAPVVAKLPVVGLAGYDIDVFARGTANYSNPDSVVVAGKYVYIGYQNITAKDGTDHKTSTIVQYSSDGKALKTFSMPGHNDGLRYDNQSHLLWASSNEDGNPVIVTIDTETGVVTPYTVPATPHGGGYDDIFFIKGVAFITASNPTLDPTTGVNIFPAIDKIMLQNGKAILTPVLMGNATALDTITNQKVVLNLTDPDSLAIDNQGNLVLNDQADAQFITLHNPGTVQQTVTRTQVGTQTDDIVWIPAKEGRLLIVDGTNNIIYSASISTDFTKNTVYTEAPSDSGVAGFVATVDLKTGTLIPVIIGLGSPTGLAFQPSKEN